MCEFVSWLEMPGKGDTPRVLFLTDDLIPKAIDLGIDPIDIAGHEAIRRVFGLNRDDGRERERTDFSTPANLPLSIARAIAQGRMKGFGPVPTGILRKPLDDDYEAKRKALYDDYLALVGDPANRSVAWQVKEEVA